MGTLQWNESLETGDAAIDTQHRTLLELFNDLVRTEAQDGPAAVRDALGRLTEYVSVHFAMEEDLMRREGLPADALDEHVAEHRGLTGKVREQVIAYRTGRLDTVGPLAEFLSDWLCHHVREVDTVLVSHMRLRRSAEG